MDNIHICCPKCKWEPDGKPYWQCTCGTVWDTFSTGARCPSCGIVWKDTQCIIEAGGCNKSSPHLDWYEGLEDIIKKLKEEIEQGWKVEVAELVR
ncbi:MAG: hypothetical protein H0U39_09775 [Segetibacter sp.]|jgi:uncharacterized C2H2 Zn-finger protein|nr:hypothetical protein [Segetibacter sp.]